MNGYYETHGKQKKWNSYREKISKFSLNFSLLIEESCLNKILGFWVCGKKFPYDLICIYIMGGPSH